MKARKAPTVMLPEKNSDERLPKTSPTDNPALPWFPTRHPLTHDPTWPYVADMIEHGALDRAMADPRGAASARVSTGTFPIR